MTVDPTQQEGNAPEPQPVAQPAPVTPTASEPVAPVAQPAPAQPQVPVKAVEPLPDAAQERTREQFEKLLESNRRLYEANELLRQEMTKRSETNQVFQPIQTPAVTPQPRVATPQDVNPSDFVEVDPVTGEQYINESKLKARMEEITNKAARAEQIAQQYAQQAEKREIERQNKEAFGAYPELNPGSQDFDSRFSNQTRAILYDSMINSQDYGGRPLSFREAAEFVKGAGPSQSKTMDSKVEAVEQAAQQQNQAQAAQELKEQGSLQAVSNAEPAQRVQLSTDEDLRQLQVRTRLGDDEALARRLLNTDHIKGDEA
jgi:hypothetical protein